MSNKHTITKYKVHTSINIYLVNLMYLLPPKKLINTAYVNNHNVIL